MMVRLNPLCKIVLFLYVLVGIFGLIKANFGTIVIFFL